MRKQTSISLLALLAFGLLLSDLNQASAVDWSQPIIARGHYRAKLQATPIEKRPNRPFHFYGNTVRRVHHIRHSGGVMNSFGAVMNGERIVRLGRVIVRPLAR